MFAPGHLLTKYGSVASPSFWFTIAPVVLHLPRAGAF